MFLGSDSTNESISFVSEYTTKKALSKIGYTFDESELTDFEAEYLTFIGAEFSSLETKENEKKMKARRR